MYPFVLLAEAEIRVHSDSLLDIDHEGVGAECAS